MASVDSGDLIGRCVAALDERLRVDALRYVVQHGALRPDAGPGVRYRPEHHRHDRAHAASPVRSRYDLLGELAVRTQLTRRTIAAILGRVSPATFAKYRDNPEQFIAGSARLISEQLNALMEWPEHA